MSAHSEWACQLEDGLRLLPGVLNARVVLDDVGDITELHIVATSAKPAKQVVRDVVTFVVARLGIEVDRRVISVVQIADADERRPTGNGATPSDETPPRPTPAKVNGTEGRPGSRPALNSAKFEHHGSRFVAEVSLRRDHRRMLGRAEGPNSPSRRPMVAAMAALDSVRQLSPSLATAQLESARIETAQVVSFGAQAAAVVTVSLLAAASEELLIGAALVGQAGPDLAAIRALLDALNRRIAPRLLDDPTEMGHTEIP